MLGAPALRRSQARLEARLRASDLASQRSGYAQAASAEHATDTVAVHAVAIERASGPLPSGQPCPMAAPTTAVAIYRMLAALASE